MNKLTVTFVLAAGVLAPITAHAGDSPDNKDHDPKAIIDELWNSEVGKKYLQEPVPGGDRMDPGPRCKSIDAGVRFDLPLYSQGADEYAFSIEATAIAKLFANSSGIGIEASIGPTVKVFSVLNVKPIDVALQATTTNAGENALLLEVDAFGYTVFSRTLASTMNPISESWFPTWNLAMEPDAARFTGSIDKELPCPGSCTATFRGTWATVAEVGAIFLLGIDATSGFDVRFGGHAAAYANMNATLTVANGDSSFTPSATANIVLGRLTFAGRGIVAPWNAHWLADAGAVMIVDEALGGALSLNTPIFSYSPYSLTPTSFWKDWSYQCTLDKPF